MSKLSLVYGGQLGSEGKGQLCAAIARDADPDDQLWAVRVGGPNAGHTVTAVDGRTVKVQQIPSPAFTKRGVVPVIGCSGLILPEVLDRELDLLYDLWGPDPPTVFIDHQAVVITEEHMLQERDLKKSIASTGEGVGAATADKVMRKAATIEDMWEDLCETYHHWPRQVVLTDTVPLLNMAADEDDVHVIIEGTQGYLLSLSTSGYYPYCTSRECGPEAIMGQIGLSFRAFDKVDVVCVMRTYPIRVGGNSGPLPGEITWEELGRRTRGYVDTPERTTVTNKIRRIAEFNLPLALRTIKETRPTSIALTFLDYVFPGDARREWMTHLSEGAGGYVEEMEGLLGVPIEWVSTGPGQRYTFDRRDELPF